MSAGNAYDVPFSLAQSVKQNDGTFKLSTQLSSKNFCHSSNGSNYGYYILIQVFRLRPYRSPFMLNMTTAMC